MDLCVSSMIHCNSLHHQNKEAKGKRAVLCLQSKLNECRSPLARREGPRACVFDWCVWWGGGGGR